MDNKMTTHKVQGIIKPDRRVEQVATPTIVVNGRYEAEQERTTPHNYFVGERERRKKQVDWRGGHDRPRITAHNYDSPPLPKKLIYIKVEPEPDIQKIDSQELRADGLHIWDSGRKSVLHNPYQKDDILELGEPWINSADYGNVTKTQLIEITQDHSLRAGEEWQPASTCPSELCKKIKVDKVIGVGRTLAMPRNKIEMYSPVKKWHWFILSEEVKNET